MTKSKINKKFACSFPCHGEIYLVYLNPRHGREVGKLRPALVISNDIQNEYDHHIIVAPLLDYIWEQSGKTKIFEVFIKVSPANGLVKDSKILLNRLRAIDKKLRLRDYVGVAGKEIIEEVNKKLELVLNIKKIL